MPTCWKSSTVRALAAQRSRRRWRRRTSATCRPTGYTGFREVIGSWKIMAIRLPRSFRSAPSPKVRRSVSPKRISPAATRPAGGTRPSTDRAVTLLPQPDSPTSPTILPRGMARSTPSTAARGPSGVRNSVRRPVMVRVFCRASTVFPPLPGFLHSVSLAQAGPLGNSFAPRSLRQRSSAKIPAKNF